MVDQRVNVAYQAVNDVAHGQNLKGHAVHGVLDLGNRNVQGLCQLVHIAMKAVDLRLQGLQLGRQRRDGIHQPLLDGAQKVKQFGHHGGDVIRQFFHHVSQAIAHETELNLDSIGFATNSLADFADAFACFDPGRLRQGAQIVQNLRALGRRNHLGRVLQLHQTALQRLQLASQPHQTRLHRLGPLRQSLNTVQQSVDARHHTRQIRLQTNQPLRQGGHRTGHALQIPRNPAETFAGVHQAPTRHGQLPRDGLQIALQTAQRRRQITGNGSWIQRRGQLSQFAGDLGKLVAHLQDGFLPLRQCVRQPGAQHLAGLTGGCSHLGRAFGQSSVGGLDELQGALITACPRWTSRRRWCCPWRFSRQALCWALAP